MLLNNVVFNMNRRENEKEEKFENETENWIMGVIRVNFNSFNIWKPHYCSKESEKRYIRVVLSYKYKSFKSI